MEARLPIPPANATEYERRLFERLNELFRQMSPAEGWKDKEGSLTSAKIAGSKSPTWSIFLDGICAWEFSASVENEVWLNFHMPHDMAFYLKREDGTYQGATIYPHVHWSPSGTDTGVARFGIEYTIAKGYSQEVFPATTTIYLEQAGSGTANMHQIIETTDDNAIVNDSIETDAIMQVRLFRDATHANDTLTDTAFVTYMDLHYYSDGKETNERNRNNTSGELPWTKKEPLEN